MQKQFSVIQVNQVTAKSSGNKRVSLLLRGQSFRQVQIQGNWVVREHLGQTEGLSDSQKKAKVYTDNGFLASLTSPNLELQNYLKPGDTVTVNIEDFSAALLPGNNGQEPRAVLNITGDIVSFGERAIIRAFQNAGSSQTSSQTSSAPTQGAIPLNFNNSSNSNENTQNANTTEGEMKF